ncbi:hypothetical protein [Streptomyces sp. NRRL F-5727]|uniref:hypothetical protein n=1 Tax=Streptomyces sp. NRRL F-5727 TaxID=1463871 RepID=UPI001F1C86FF|nr:hypothetical protein [Streptomyces sp. NRRL F-5727]
MAFTEKILTVPEPVGIGGRHVKRCHVTSDQAGIEPEVAKAAYALLPELLPEPDGTPAAGFAVLHRGTDLPGRLADSLRTGTTATSAGSGGPAA